MRFVTFSTVRNKVIILDYVHRSSPLFNHPSRTLKSLISRVTWYSILWWYSDAPFEISWLDPKDFPHLSIHPLDVVFAYNLFSHRTWDMDCCAMTFELFPFFNLVLTGDLMLVKCSVDNFIKKLSVRESKCGSQIIHSLTSHQKDQTQIWKRKKMVLKIISKVYFHQTWQTFPAKLK
jgi:hypothetical protein